MVRSLNRQFKWKLLGVDDLSVRRLAECESDWAYSVMRANFTAGLSGRGSVAFLLVWGFAALSILSVTEWTVETRYSAGYF
jgi:hypothetical protein